MTDTWGEIEARLHQLYALPHNAVLLRDDGHTASEVVARKIAELSSGIVGTPQREEFLGPKVFLRVGGPANAAYGGNWWFDGAVLDRLDEAYSRICLQPHDLDDTLRNLLREALAVRTEWNPITEIWSLRLPPGERLTGWSGVGARQPLFGNLPLSAQGNRMLVGGVRQVWFPVKNPLWVQLHRHLH